MTENQQDAAHAPEIAGSEGSDLARDVRATDAEAGWNERAEQRRERSRGRVVATRGAAGVTALAIAALGALGASVLPGVLDAPAIGAVPVEQEGLRVVPSGGIQQVVCPPAVLRTGEDPLLALAVTQVASGEVRTVAPAAATADTMSIVGVNGDPLRVVTAPADAEPISGGVVARVDTSGVKGLAAGACTAPGVQHWLVGGSTGTGRQTLLTLANPGAQPAVVHVTVYSPGEQVTSERVIEPGSAQVIDLASAVVGNSAPVVQVTSEGVPVGAFLQQHSTRVLEPTGVAFVESVPQASTSLVLPGVVVTDHAHTEPADEALFDHAALRLLATERDTEVTIRFVGSGEPVEQRVSLTASEVQQPAFDAVPAGEYDVFLQADAPIVAGARVTPAAGDADADYAWAAATQPLTGTFTVDAAGEAAGKGVTVRARLVNPTDADIVAQVAGKDVTVPAGRGVTVDTVPTGHVTLTGDGIHAALYYSGEGVVAVRTVQPAPAEAAAITVTVHG